jgi:hypothetical protein
MAPGCRRLQSGRRLLDRDQRSRRLGRGQSRLAEPASRCDAARGRRRARPDPGPVAGRSRLRVDGSTRAGRHEIATYDERLSIAPAPEQARSFSRLVCVPGSGVGATPRVTFESLLLRAGANQPSAASTRSRTGGRGRHQGASGCGLGINPNRAPSATCL